MVLIKEIIQNVGFQLFDFIKTLLKCSDISKNPQGKLLDVWVTFILIILQLNSQPDLEHLPYLVNGRYSKKHAKLLLIYWIAKHKSPNLYSLKAFCVFFD